MFLIIIMILDKQTINQDVFGITHTADNQVNPDSLIQSVLQVIVC